MKQQCKEMTARVGALASDLRHGRILGSTEAAYAALSFLSDAVKICRQDFVKHLPSWIETIIGARPTSMVMSNLIREFLIGFVDEVKKSGVETAIEKAPAIIDRIYEEIEHTKKIVARVGAKRIVNGDVILTHSYSTSVIRIFEEALREGKNFSVYVTESRPLGEGLIAAEKIAKMGVDTTLIVDSAVRFVMKKINKVIVGADAVAANGAIVNKAGTSAIALAAKEARTRVLVAAGTYKFGIETVFGELIEGIVLNDPELIIPPDRMGELTGKVIVREPVFDVTPPEYIDAIITEHGLIAPQAVPILIKEKYGLPPKVKSIKELLREVRSL